MVFKIVAASESFPALGNFAGIIALVAMYSLDVTTEMLISLETSVTMALDWPRVFDSTTDIVAIWEETERIVHYGPSAVLEIGYCMAVRVIRSIGTLASAIARATFFVIQIITIRIAAGSANLRLGWLEACDASSNRIGLHWGLKERRS
jgi:hypothetical protein